MDTNMVSEQKLIARDYLDIKKSEQKKESNKQIESRTVTFEVECIENSYISNVDWALEATVIWTSVWERKEF